MIVPMKKIYVVVQKKHIAPALEALRELGSIHVEHQEPLSGYQLEERREEVEILEKAVEILGRVQTKKDFIQRKAGDWTETVNTVLNLSAQIERHTENMAKQQAFIRQWERWGDFRPQDIKEMSSKGVFVRLYVIPKEKMKDVPNDVIVQTVYSSAGVNYCVAVSRKQEDLPYETVALPETGLSRIQSLRAEERGHIDEINRRIEEHCCYLDSLKEILMERRNVLGIEEVQKGMKEEEALAVLKGYCPADICQDIQQKAKQEHWGILFENPSEGDQVPTLLKNPKWVEMIKPVFGMINIVPGYKEFDISFLFLMFFSIFVGILIGDAGYAVIYALFFKFVLPRIFPHMPERKIFYRLMYLLCASTFIWGALTGTYFGQQWLPSGIKPIVPWLKDTHNIQVLCFLIGAIHLSIAHFWRTMVQFPKAAFLGEAGWLMIIWGMYGWAKNLVLGDPSPGFLLLIIGAVLVVFFTKPNINPLKAIGGGLGGLLLNVINSFTDIVSYIRLFAVGLATVAVADAANTMSLGWVFFLHTLNILLAAMAVLVHGLRLNVLEFSGHLGMEWAGFKYNPFRKTEK